MTRARAGRFANRLSALAYRALLLRYPRRMRRTYGAEMEAAFLRLLTEAARRDGPWGWVKVWIRALGEAARPLPGPVTRGVGPEDRPATLGGKPSGVAAHLWSDASAAARSLRRAPGFTLLVVGVLGVGIAFNVSIFAVVQAYLLRPLPYPHPERLVQVRPATSATGWRGSGDVFEKAVSWNLDGFTLVGDPDPEVVLGAWVTPDFFDVFGVRPALGRTFTDGEADASTAVIGHDVWMRRFGGDPRVVGRALRLYASDDGAGELLTFTVVGVLPADFWYVNRYTEVLLPLRVDGPVYAGRLRSDVPPERAEGILTERAVSRAGGGVEEGFRVRVRPLQEAYADAIRRRLTVLQATALLVFLVACANAGLLLLVRAEGRHREMAMRQALGAGRGRLALQLTAEGLILAGLAGLLGLALGTASLAGLGGVIQSRVGRAVPGGLGALQVDASVVLLTTGALMVVGILLGSVPLWTPARRDLARLIGSGRRRSTAPAGARRARRLLVTVEVALSLTLLTGGALMVRSALHLERTRLGFDPSGLLVCTVGLTSEGSGDPSRRVAFFETLARRTVTLPGVEAVGLARSAPFAGGLVTRVVEVEGPAGGPLPEAVPQVASPGYFTALGLSAVRGRVFTEDDGPGTEPVAVVSESLADRLWPGDPAVGRRVRFSAWRMPEMSESPGSWVTVIGVVPDVVDGLEGARPALYVPFRQAATAWMDLVVRTRPGVTGTVDGIRAVLRELDPDVPIYAQERIGRAVSRARAPSRFFAGLLSGFSAFALLLALLGLYGVAAYAARQRRRDLAIRMALGAGRRSVEGLFVRESLGTLAVGLAVGAVGGRFLGRALSGQLHGVSGDDPATAAAVAGLLAVTAILAAWIPARQAARADPAGILREE